MCGTNTVVQQQNDIPSWISQPTQQLIGQAQQQAQQPYTPYPGQQVADLGPQTYQGIGLAENNINSFQPYFNNANSLVQAGAGGVGNTYSPNTFTTQNVNSPTWDGNAASAYMNPFLSTVGDHLTQQINQQYDQQAQQNNTAATMAGAYGGERAGWTNAQNDYYRNMAIGSTLGQLGMSAYTNAENQFNADAARNQQGQMFNSQANLLGQQLTNQSQVVGAQLAQADMQRQLQAAQIQANMGGSAFGMGQQQAQGLLGIGGMQQQQAQNQINANVNTFNAQRQWPYQNIGFLSDIIRGAPYAGGSTQTSQGANPIGQVAGLGLTGLALYNGLSGAFAGAGGAGAAGTAAGSTAGAAGGGYAVGGAADAALSAYLAGSAGETGAAAAATAAAAA